MFRIFKYDLSKSIDDLNITGEGLLAKRHGIRVGMFLVSGISLRELNYYTLFIRAYPEFVHIQFAGTYCVSF